MKTKSPALSFVGNLLLGVIPAMLIQVRRLPAADKLTFAGFIRDLCTAYETGDRLTFDRLLGKVQALETPLREELERALWENYDYGDNPTDPRHG